MFTSHLLALAAAISSVSAVYQGFNYGAVHTDESAMVQSDYQNLFTTAQNLVGNSGFTSARIYTMIQAGTTNSPTEAIPAAIATNTTLLLGLWASAGQTIITNELAALTSAITLYGTNFTNLIVGISVGSEDLYRNSPTGIENKAGIGANPADIVSYISQLRSAISGTGASGAPIGHVDTWTAWVNGSNNAVINSCDFLGMDAYPYFQTTEANSIDAAYDVFFQAYNNTKGAGGGKPVYITETGWPISGPNSNLAVASLQNAQTYWNEVACTILGKINTWWFTLQDASPTTPSPSFGIVGSTLSTTPLINLTCPAIPYSSTVDLTGSLSNTTSPNTTSSNTPSPSNGSGSSALPSTGSTKTSVPTSGASRALIDSGVVAVVIAIALL